MRRLPRWTPYVVFVVVVVAVVAYGAVRNSPEANQPKPRIIEADSLPPVSQAEGVVLRWWRGIQVGSTPTSILYYHPRVISTLGQDEITGALASQRPALAAMRPSVQSSLDTPLGVEVTVRATGAEGGAPIYYSVILERAGSSWRILYDSLLGDAIGPFVQAREQRRLAPQAKEPVAAAVQAGEDATLEFRNLFVSGEEEDAGATEEDENAAKAPARSRRPKRTATPTATPTP